MSFAWTVAPWGSRLLGEARSEAPFWVARRPQRASQPTSVSAGSDPGRLRRHGHDRALTGWSDQRLPSPFSAIAIVRFR